MKHEISVSRRTHKVDKSAHAKEIYHHNINDEKIAQEELIVANLVKEYKLFDNPNIY